MGLQDPSLRSFSSSLTPAVLSQIPLSRWPESHTLWFNSKQFPFVVVGIRKGKLVLSLGLG